MPRKTKPTGDAFLEILNNDSYKYVLTSKTSEPIDVNFPNLPDVHKNEFEEWRHEILPDAKVICFEYNETKYKLLMNMGDADCNDGIFGALYDDKNQKIVDLLSTGDMETTIQSVNNEDEKMDDGLPEQLTPYLEFFEVILDNNTAMEYLVFKVLYENDCLYDLSGLEDRYGSDSDYED